MHLLPEDRPMRWFWGFMVVWVCLLCTFVPAQAGYHFHKGHVVAHAPVPGVVVAPSAVVVAPQAYGLQTVAPLTVQTVAPQTYTLSVVGTQAVQPSTVAPQSCVDGSLRSRWDETDSRLEAVLRRWDASNGRKDGTLPRPTPGGPIEADIPPSAEAAAVVQAVKERKISLERAIERARHYATAAVQAYEERVAALPALAADPTRKTEAQAEQAYLRYINVLLTQRGFRVTAVPDLK
jgi:hypothetical protein